jgi:hypothetical protein
VLPCFEARKSAHLTGERAAFVPGDDAARDYTTTLSRFAARVMPV